MFCIVKANEAGAGYVYWTGQQWSCIACEAKRYPSIAAALNDTSVPPAITEVIKID